MIETKKEMDMNTAMVQEKARAAEQYCRAATEFTSRNDGKPWTYVLIPHNAVFYSMGFESLMERYAYHG
ncbi:MAG: hypothetical protein COS57_10375 [Syntrophobacterales bacterium CG03_land_8_20_14_0_80_58_14]|nr:MAG: hypothetical protein COS57_10375 [Syntrophobacterales bacterium CG03_land_8_20_14_0_80_58_14]